MAAEHDQEAALQAVCEQLRRARRVLFITGAGVSADSGLPTYRGIGGLYEERLTDDDVPIEVALSGEMFREEPRLTWKYIFQIERACRGASYNDAHRVICEMESAFDVCVLTQNVDGFHRRAGSRHVIEIHGDIHQLLCEHCRFTRRVTDYLDLNLPPRCPECESILRPRVVLFNEALPQHAVMDWYAAQGRGFDLVFSVGTGSVFPYIAAPVVEAIRAGVPTIEINPGDSEVSSLVDHRLRRGAAGCLRELWERYQAGQSSNAAITL